MLFGEILVLFEVLFGGILVLFGEILVLFGGILVNEIRDDEASAQSY